jgi:hypothetical protein
MESLSVRLAILLRDYSLLQKKCGVERTYGPERVERIERIERDGTEFSWA